MIGSRSAGKLPSGKMGGRGRRQLPLRAIAIPAGPVSELDKVRTELAELRAIVAQIGHAAAQTAEEGESDETNS